MKTILKLSVVLVSVSLTASAFAQSGPSNRADRKITGAAYRSHAPTFRRDVYQPYVRQYGATTFAPAPVVTVPAPAPATAVAAQAGTQTYRSFSYESTSVPAPNCVAPTTQHGTQTYRSFSFEPTTPAQGTIVTPQPVYAPAPRAVFVPSPMPSRSSTTSPMWRADRKASGTAYRH